MVALNEAYAKLTTLSEEHAHRVISLIDDLADQEAMEDAEDIADAEKALARIKAGEKTIPWETVKAELDAQLRESQA